MYAEALKLLGRHGATVLDRGYPAAWPLALPPRWQTPISPAHPC